MDKHYVLKKEWFPDLVAALASRRRVVAPVAKGADNYAFEQVHDADEVALEHVPTILPPKKYFMPQVETIQRFDRAQKRWDPVIDACEETVILGLHTCDLAGIECLNQAMGSDPPDVNYVANRERLFLVAYECNQYCDEHAMCALMGNHVPNGNYDLALTDLGDRYFARVGTAMGEQFIQETGVFSEADVSDHHALAELRARKESQFSPEVSAPRAELQNMLSNSFNSEVWEDLGRRCLSCGNCTNVCPTCYCFDMQDELALDLNTGVRKRIWDSCQNEQFAVVAGGENFRKPRSARQRHRFMRKLNFSVTRFGRYFCIGCGRCSRTCMAEISMKKTLSMIAAEQKSQSWAEVSPYQVRVGTILHTRRMTDLEKYFEIEIEGRPLRYEPGQFVMVSLPGIGEAPISISSSPHREDVFELVIRKAGALTAALHQLEPGATVGIRGPYGRGFPLEQLRGRDLLLIGGGCGNIPLHSLIDYCMHDRADYGHIDILLGCRTPRSMLFTDEFEDWRRRQNVRMSLTVDVPDETWQGHVGLITALIPEVSIDPDRTSAVVVGPPVMYRSVIQELKKRDLPDDQIILSLERHMKCGVGKCGHCQIGDVYCCQDGPVFTYAEIKDKYEALDHE